MARLATAHCIGQAGHKVTLFESGSRHPGRPQRIAPAQEVGVDDALERVAVRPEAIRIAYTRWSDMEKEYDAPYYDIHRADMHKLLFELAASIIQKVVHGHTNPAEPTGDAVYRAVVPADLLLQKPDLNARAKKEYSIVLAHPDDRSVESQTAEGSAAKVRADFADYEPGIRELLGFVKLALKWHLTDRHPLKTWIHPSCKVILLSDACHSWCPYRAQGVAMAIEDAAVLGNILSRRTHPAQLAPLLQAYQDVRLPRTAETQRHSCLNQETFRLPDGLEQEARDAQMRQAMEAELRMMRARGEPEALGGQDGERGPVCIAHGLGGAKVVARGGREDSWGVGVRQASGCS
ncbi:FAD/NAD(P)-binding domain-containing protein [Pilatotrama ljubarskyi]|nr:FAD/NAD(P)-binding domain-containing protein [Pilatotrama ljubarskyi]